MYRRGETLLKPVIVKSESAHYLWTTGLIEVNVGIVWDDEYAEYIRKALAFYAEHLKENQ
jgi:hypothetical protein